MRTDSINGHAQVRTLRSTARSVVLCFGAMAFVLAGETMAAPVADLKASKTSGPAPLAVHFDATGTTDTDGSVEPFRQLGYRFQFDDPGSGTWEHSDLPKNEQIGGPLAAHVFNVPGTYEVTLTVRGRSGGESTDTVTVTVQSAGSAYSGSNTVCISRNSDFAGCPDNADQMSNAGSYPTIRNNTRYLLHAGQDFTSLGNLSMGHVKNVQVGSFGSGAKPRIGGVRLQAGNPSNHEGDWIDGVTIMDLRMTTVYHENIAKNVLFLRNDIIGGTVEFSAAYLYYRDRARSLANWSNSDQNFFVENIIDSQRNETWNLTARGTRLVLLGNSFIEARTHNVRIWQAAKAVFAHNFVDGNGGSGYHSLKLHGTGLDPVLYEGSFADVSGTQQRTSQAVVANNYFEGAQNNWIVSIRPENAQSDEGVEYVIVEDSEFGAGPNHFQDITFTGRQMTSRGNWSFASNDTASSSTPSNSALPSSWIGPYFLSQPTMRDLFEGDFKVPESPVFLSVN